MILFTILLLTIAILAVFAILTVGVGGATLVLLFGDVIVCVLLIVFIVKCLTNKTWKRK